MSKITFRADDDLVTAIESMEASKSEVMREALREYLERRTGGEESLDEVVADRVDAILDDRLDAHLDERLGERETSEVNVNVTLGEDAEEDEADAAREPARASDGLDDSAGQSAVTCRQCGERVDTDHVYCPNCGEKATNRLFCECGDELRADWAFCPGCGRRTPSADVFEK